jgi:hypothetical protein
VWSAKSEVWLAESEFLSVKSEVWLAKS